MNARASRYRIAAVIGMSGLALLGLAGVGGPAAATDPCTTPANAVVAENCLPGAPPSEWDVNGAGDLSIQGFATDISANVGETVHFKIDTDASAYTIDIYRMGYYGGDGARHIATVSTSATLPQSQPACLTDGATGLIDCGNWSESASWTVPAQAASGVYIARLTRTDTGGASHIPFVVRDDAGHSDLLFETSDSTWQAYNTYGGNSLYVGGPGTNPGRAYKVSYNRPFITRGGTAEDSFFNAEYPMVRWLEANGYDISYVSGIDTARAPVSMLEQHKVFMSVGHDEYWSGEQRAHVEAARDSGVHLAFFSGNQVFWKTRWEPSIDSTTTSYRTMVSYKETHAHAKIDPNPAWTGTWRDPLGAASDGGRPENALTGTIFTVNCCTYAIQVPASDGPLRLWRNTSVAGLEGGSATLAGSSLGYEWNEDLDNGSRPPGQIDLSSTTVSVPERIQDAGSTYAPGPATHSVTMHRANSGALVFDAGTVQWSWGLDGTHDRGGSTPDPAMRQATVNLFADMTVQPATLQSGLVEASASADTLAPISSVTSPGDGDTVLAGSPTSVSGTASDTGGGHVAGVEVSTDGGTTWHPASGHSSWSYTFTPQTTGTLTIRSRATDDSVNTGPASDAVTVAVAPHQCPCSIWNTSATPGTLGNNDGQSIDYGVKFRSDDAGTISGFRFYKSPGETGTHIGHLWNTSGALLASATFASETSSGWQQVDLPTPYPIVADTTYIGSIFASSGVYPDNQAYFTGSGVDNPPLHALQSGVDGPNAVYHQGPDSFPDQTFNASNYWADVVFSNGPDTTPPVITSRSPSSNATGVAVTRPITATFDESLNASTVSSSTFELRDGSNALVPASVQYDAPTHTATLTPSSPLTSSSPYTARVTGGANGVTDAAGNALAADVSWSFTTAAPPADEGPGGPILVIATAGNPFGRYYGEILRAEGLDEFRVTDISSVTAGTLASYDVVVLGEMPLSAAQAAMLGNWVNSGGKLVAMRPDAQLAGLLGLTSAGGARSNAYLRVDTGAPPGQGITNQTIQYHGTADNYNLAGASAVATLYSDAVTATTFPAVTMHAVGANGGQAAAFSYDLARSVVYTREGNPAWSGQERDGFPPIRSDDLFFGASATDPQPDWVDLDKVAIPQADEQQRLLANLVTRMEGPRMPLPRFWYLPRGNKAVVVMTGDDHATGGTAGRFDQEIADSPPGCNVANWECVRSTSYVYPASPLTDAQAASYAAQGFEIALHVHTDCADWTPESLANFYNSQLAEWRAHYASQPGPYTMRTHCGAESDYSTQPHVELAHGIRLDTTYYYWPPTWVQNRPGMFTGSGIPMRYADADGSAIDVYQATTQMTDESGQSYPFNVDTLFDNALGAPGYYGVFTANMHTDQASSSGSDAIIASAQARGVPVVSAKQMLDWLDGRNASSFGALNWSGDVLHFDVTQGSTANGLQAMLPATSADGAPLTSITRGASTVPFTTQTIKGVAYAFFDSPSGSYVATYTPDTTAPVISSVTAAPNASGDATISWTTDEESDSSVAYGTDPDALDMHQSSGAIVTSHSITLHGLALGTTYRFRVSSADTSANTATLPAAPAVPASFTVPTVSVTDTTEADFGAGAPGACAVVAHDSDGAVELGSIVNAEFSGSSLPGGWDTLLWDPNGSVTVGGGQLVLDAARAGTTATYGSGRSLEFAATFAHETFEHIGFGIDFNDAPYAIFSTGNDGNTLKARSGDGSNATDTVLPGNLIGSPHRFRIDWTPSQILFWVDGVQVAIHSATISQMRPLVSDFHHDGTNLTVDWLRMSPFTTSCAFVSRAFDAGATSAWSTLDAATTTPNGTSVAIDTRTSDDGMSWSAWAPVNGPAITSPVGRYLEYRASLTTTDDAVTPQLTSVHATAVGMPDPPGIGTAVGGNASLAVAFTAPADHGSPITGYTASCTSSDGGAPGTHTGTTSPISVTGLTNGKTYTCIVTATNAAGTSPPSAASNAVVPATAPGAPTIGTAVRGNASIAVAFTPPTNNGGSAVTGYTATCTSSDGGTAGTHTGTTSPITVGSLTNGKTYTCIVTAQNTAGTGAPSAASNAVVPATVPGAPTIGTAVRGNTSIAVAFTPPASNGGSAVTGYTAACTSSNGGVTGTRTGTTSPITVGSLTNGKSYTCKVTAQNAVGTGAPSAASNAVVPATVPGAPTIGTVTLAGTTASVPFTAPASNGGSAITGYTATCTSSNGGATKSASQSTSPISVLALSPTKTYTCQAFATNAVGNGAASAASNVVTVANVPGAPTIGTAVRGNASISVPFTGPANNGGSAITGYTATCTSSNGGTTGGQAGPASPISVGGLTNGKSYTCKVTAQNAVGTGAPSAASNAVVPATVPGAPTIGTATAAIGSASVAFTAPAGDGGSAITGYTATCTSSNGGATGTHAGVSSPITVTGLAAAKSYTCTVAATNAVGTGVASAPSNTVIIPTVPAAPRNVTAVSGSTTATTGPLSVSFAAPLTNGGSPITGFTATCVSSNGGVTGTQTGPLSPFTVTGLTTGKTYTCTVVATNAVGTGAASTPSPPVIVGSPASPTVVSVVTGSTTSPTGPVVVTFTAGADNGAAITGYTATCTSSNGGVTGTQSGAASPITVTGLTTGKTYTCSVAATNSRGIGLGSALSSALIVGAPAAPTGVKATAGSTAAATGPLTVTYTGGANNGAAITSYTATCTSSNGGVTGTQSGAASPITVTGLTTAKTYTCTVIATNARGTGLASAPSAPVIVGSPQAPTGVSAVKVANGQLRVTFTAGANNGAAITSYTATCTSSNGGITGTQSGAASPITVTGLTTAKTYTCTVIATNARGTGLASAPSAGVGA